MVRMTFPRPVFPSGGCLSSPVHTQSVPGSLSLVWTWRVIASEFGVRWLPAQGQVLVPPAILKRPPHVLQVCRCLHVGGPYAMGSTSCCGFSWSSPLCCGSCWSSCCWPPRPRCRTSDESCRCLFHLASAATVPVAFVEDVFADLGQQAVFVCADCPRDQMGRSCFDHFPVVGSWCSLACR